MKKPTGDDDSLRTRATLLIRLRDGSNEQAWVRFYGIYRRVILSMARRWGLSEQSAQDLLQDVMLAVSRRSHAFAYDAETRTFSAGGAAPADGARHGGFRQWLYTVVKRAAWKQVYAPRRRREINVSDLVAHQDEESWQKFYEQEPAPEDAPDELAEAKTKKIYRLALLEQAIRLLPSSTKRSHPRKIVIFLALKQSHVFDAIPGMKPAPLPAKHMAEYEALAKLKKVRGGTITKSDIMKHYNMSGDHVDHEVSAIKEKLKQIFIDLYAGHEPIGD